jgi:predicted helicase
VFAQLAQPSGAGRLGLSDQLDWATHLLNRVNRDRFFARFEEEHAVQYFYEPFLKEFDPELRKQLGVWYTPPEVVKYMVARVDQTLRDELSIPDGLADPSVYVLDPCCGTGAYLVEVLRRIETTLKENRGADALIGADAATGRIFGFEIMPAPFVVAHLQLGLHLQHIKAPLEPDERPAIYLTNALTGWEPSTSHPKSLLYPELDEERDAAEHVKRDRPILVVIGNPPYNGYAGVAVEEERDLTDAYRSTKRAPKPQGQGLNDLYVRFFRMAERRIAEQTGKGIVCFISNY